MDVNQSTLDAIYTGWRHYQELFITALLPLTPEQLAFQAASNLRSIESIATHIIGACGRWFAPPLGDGNTQLAAFSRWDRRGGSVRTAAEIVTGLQFTLGYIHTTISHWSPSDWLETLPGEGLNDPAVETRQWVI